MDHRGRRQPSGSRPRTPARRRRARLGVRREPTRRRQARTPRPGPRLRCRALRPGPPRPGFLGSSAAGGRPAPQSSRRGNQARRGRFALPRARGGPGAHRSRRGLRDPPQARPIRPRGSPSHSSGRGPRVRRGEPPTPRPRSRSPSLRAIPGNDSRRAAARAPPRSGRRALPGTRRVPELRRSRAYSVSHNGSPYTRTSPSLTIRPAAGNAGQTRAVRRPNTSIAAATSSGIGPRNVESTFLNTSRGRPGAEPTPGRLHGGAGRGRREGDGTRCSPRAPSRDARSAPRAASSPGGR